MNLRVIPYNPSPLQTEEIAKPKLTVELIMKSLGVNIVDNEKRKDLLYMSVNSTCLWEERKAGAKHYKEVSIKENNILEELYQAHKLAITNRDATVIKSNTHGAYEVDFSQWLLLKPRVSELR